MSAITEVLESLRNGSARQTDELYSLTYDTLKRIAARRLAGRSIIHPTELVHETWIRLAGSETIPWENSKHFFRAAAEAMRFTLLDHVRRRYRVKRGVDFSRQELDELTLSIDPLGLEILSLNEALEKFEAAHPDQAQVVNLKFFAGMTINEIAQVMDLSTSTVDRYWAFSKAWLHTAMVKR